MDRFGELCYNNFQRIGSMLKTINPLPGMRETVIDVVGSPQSKEDFPGLFGIPFKCLTYSFINATRLLMTSQWRSSIQVRTHCTIGCEM